MASERRHRTVEDAPPTREYRAALTFLTTAAFAAVAALAALIGWLVPPAAQFLAVLGSTATAVALLVGSIGLATGRPWATAAMTPILWILIVAHAISFLRALDRGALEIPITGLLALWSLAAAPRRTSAAPRHTATSAVLVGAIAVTAAWPAVTDLALRPGGPLIVPAEALVPNLRVDGACQAVGGPGAPPESAEIVFGWSWTREPLPAGFDAIVIEWFTQRGDGLSGYGLAGTSAGSRGIWEANRWTGDNPGVILGVDLGIERDEPAAVRVSLSRPHAAPTQHGSIEVYARYLHAPQVVGDAEALAIWSRVEQARCEW